MDRANQFATVDDAFMLSQFCRQRCQPFGENAFGVVCGKRLNRSLLERRTDITVETSRLRRLPPDGFAVVIPLFGAPRRFGDGGGKRGG